MEREYRIRYKARTYIIYIYVYTNMCKPSHFSDVNILYLGQLCAVFAYVVTRFIYPPQLYFALHIYLHCIYLILQTQLRVFIVRLTLFAK